MARRIRSRAEFDLVPAGAIIYASGDRTGEGDPPTAFTVLKRSHGNEGVKYASVFTVIYNADDFYNSWERIELLRLPD